jgi:hypothetical protein
MRPVGRVCPACWNSTFFSLDGSTYPTKKIGNYYFSNNKINACAYINSFLSNFETITLKKSLKFLSYYVRKHPLRYAKGPEKYFVRYKMKA